MSQRRWARGAVRAALSAVALAALTFGTLTLGPASPAGAQSGPTVVNTQQVNDFPREVLFSALVENADTLAEAVLFYTILPEGPLTRAPADITRGEVTRISASVPTNRDQIFVPSGADFEWYWELTDADGVVTETNPVIWRYEDPRYDWRALHDGEIELRYYDNEPIARALLAQARDVLSLIQPLLGVDLALPVKIYVWANNADASGVERVESEGFEQVIVTGGTRVLADLIHIFQTAPWVVRHELTHVLTKLAGEGSIGQLPAWLDEGTATYAEGNWRTAGSTRGPALAFAIQNDLLLTAQYMTATTNRPDEVEIFYGQAADMVTFLIDEFGAEAFATLFATFKAGSTVDNALQAVYGFDRAGLDDAYRASLGLDPAARGEDRSTVIEDAPIESPSATPGFTESTADPEPTAEADPAAGPRSDEEIDARRAIIEQRLDQRRPGPLFTTSGDFPWEELVTGVGGGALLLGVIVFWVLLKQAPLGAPRTAVGVVSPPSPREDDGPPPPEDGSPAASPPREDGSLAWPGWRGPTDDSPPDR